MPKNRTRKISDAERLGYHYGLALGNAVVRSMGGDPDKPTVAQAKAAASAILGQLGEYKPDHNEIQESITLAKQLRRETH